MRSFWAATAGVCLGGVACSTPDAVPCMVGTHTPVHLRAGVMEVMVVFDDGSVQCWGVNAVGECAVPHSYTSTDYLPMLVPRLSCVVDVALGSDGGAAVHKDGTVSVWSLDMFDELSDGPT